jgi:hypothetical protein
MEETNKVGTDLTDLPEIGQKVRRIRRNPQQVSHVTQFPQISRVPEVPDAPKIPEIKHEEEDKILLPSPDKQPAVSELRRDSFVAEIKDSDQFLAYILENGPNTLPKSTTTQRYSIEHLRFTGVIPEGLYHIFGVAKDLLGSSYRPKECNLAVGKIKY